MSLLNKFDDVTELCRDRRIDVLTELWHDVDGAVLGRLRSAGYNVVDSPCPRTADDMEASSSSLRPTSPCRRLPLRISQVRLNVFCVKAVSGRFSAIVVVLYRPGSTAVQCRFFDELSAVLDRVATYPDPVYITGDFNIRLELHATGPTHQLGGTLDAVITHERFY